MARMSGSVSSDMRAAAPCNARSDARGQHDSTGGAHRSDAASRPGPCNLKESFMTSKRISFTVRTLMAAGLVAAGVAAHAASGFQITKSQESMVAPGMTAQQVRSAIGTPDRQEQYGNEAGPTYSYRVIDGLGTRFDVDFGADGKVASAGELVDESGGGE
jgi:hypothetical protein